MVPYAVKPRVISMALKIPVPTLSFNTPTHQTAHLDTVPHVWGVLYHLTPQHATLPTWTKCSLHSPPEILKKVLESRFLTLVWPPGYIDLGIRIKDSNIIFQSEVRHNHQVLESIPFSFTPFFAMLWKSVDPNKFTYLPTIN